MSAQAQILDWSTTQSSWRRDALRRLLAGPLAPNDENQILELLKAAYKLADTDLVPQPLVIEHIPPGDGSEDRITLVALSDVTNANRLAPNQTLTFAPIGITLVYGDNGSGKSGYARILKKACRARVVETVLNNVFDTKAPKQPASARLDVMVGADQSAKSVKWEDGKPGPVELARIAVFDNKCASVYVDNENQVTFIPYNLDCFERLAALCDRLKGQLTRELEALQTTTATPVLALPEGTVAHTLLSLLGTKTDAELDTATAWAANDTARLNELSSLVTDPEKRALTLRQLQAQLKQLRSTVAAVSAHISSTGIEALKEKKRAMKATRLAAELTASQAFAKEPLPGAGMSPWRVLYEAARAYSEQEAYRGETFPVTNNGARCVLCQQPLDAEAKARLDRFDTFVSDEVTKKADSALTEWEAWVKAFRDATANLAPLSQALDNVLKAENAPIRDAVITYVTEAIAVRKQIENAVIGDADEPLGKIPTISLGEFDGYLEAIDKNASASEGAAKDDTAIKLRKELGELQSRSQLHANKTQITKRLSELRTLKKLEGAIKACSTTGISQKGTELLKEHVTGEFDNALGRERKALGIEDIPLRLMSRSPKGSPSHQLRLDQTTFAGNTSAILSEGEHRALALASFLAEQKMVPGNAPIVIDDPVSSLDHDRRHRVAHRLMEEAKSRQVIVFTHDLLFYMDASFIATEKQVPLKKIGIKRGPSGYGTIDPDGDPWAAKLLGKRRAWLDQQHAKLKKLHGDGHTEEYTKEASFFYVRLRETWERLIEEGLFANVVVRYRRSVETKRLTFAVLDDSLVTRVYNSMTAISEHTAHDRPAAAGTSLPAPDLMRQHLDDLIACLAAVEDESKIASKRREKLEKPPAA